MIKKLFDEYDAESIMEYANKLLKESIESYFPNASNDQWHFCWHSCKGKAMGTCSIIHNHCTLNIKYQGMLSYECVLDTIRHEIAHVMDYLENNKLGHGRTFRKWAVILGATPRAKGFIIYNDKFKQAGIDNRPKSRYYLVKEEEDGTYYVDTAHRYEKKTRKINADTWITHKVTKQITHKGKLWLIESKNVDQVNDATLFRFDKNERTYKSKSGVIYA